jgi:hypothetical protein
LYKIWEIIIVNYALSLILIQLLENLESAIVKGIKAILKFNAIFLFLMAGTLIVYN